ncbi:MAG TPA: bifunctional nuclease family protein [Spirochaetota bacterium]|nr:bifunctional nuclease family protein [Spirochaetota bacterium]HOM38858.1 bifunctional nuclease family protein [Spirochaetota bacterium]HPQ49153.1 bifunctional nuclease family protein [Spirochaetota bacterium]
MDINEIIPASIIDVNFSEMGFIVFLKPEKDEYKDVAVPIFIGIPEAQNLAIQFNKIRTARPFMMDIFYSFLKLLDIRVSKVIISDLIDKTFYGTIYFEDKNNKSYKIDSRSSDALIMALRFDADIYIKSYIIEEAGIKIKKEMEIIKDAPINLKTRLETLEEELKKALEEERYEDAAKIRDEIKKFKGEIN